jgi:hypothetical protein
MGERGVRYREIGEEIEAEEEGAGEVGKDSEESEEAYCQISESLEERGENEEQKAASFLISQVA